MTTIGELPTPALIVDDASLEANLATMAARLPGSRLRPHVKATKSTELAARQAQLGHSGFTCATPREVVGMSRAGLGTDLLLANECLDPGRLAAMAAERERSRITVAVDSTETIDAAARAGIGEVLIDVSVGMPRCGCAPEAAGRLAEMARSRGLVVRGVMGYEGHLMMIDGHDERARRVAEAMELLHRAADAVGGDVVSAGGTGTFDLHDSTGVTEVQAGSYSLMDTHYAMLGLPFVQAVWVLGTVISVSPGHAVADVGLKALGMDHGLPAIDGMRVWFCADEHVTFSPESATMPRVGDRVRVTPAHVDPTVALHDRAWLVDGDEVTGSLAIDLRGW